MTQRERLVGTLRGTTVDRPSMPYWLGYVPWGDTLERWRAESGIADLDPVTYFGFDPWFEVPPVDWGPCPVFPNEAVSEDADFIVTRDYRGILMRNRRDGASMPEWLSHPITTRADWETYRRERLSVPVEARCRQLDGFARKMTTFDAPVQIGVFPWGVFGTLRDLMGVENCLLAFYDDPDLVREIMETFTDLWISLYRVIATRVRVDHVHIWEDMSGKQGSLISMEMVKRFMMPCYERIVACAAELGAPLVTVDTDGMCDELVETMTGHGINGFMPFEVQAGNDVEVFRRRYPELAIMGGLDKSALAADRARIDRELGKAERMLAAGRYLAGFDHAIPPDVPWENYRYAMTELRRMIFG